MRPSRRRGYLANVIAVNVGLVSITAIASDLSHDGRPRDVFVAATVTIDPVPTTTAIADSDVYGMPQALVPTGPFADGYQDFSKTNGMRVWYSEATGAHSGTKHASDVWVPELGVALTDETGGPASTTMEFEHGKITWTPRTGSKITWAPDSTPTTTPTAQTTLTTTTAPSTTTPATPKPGNPLVAVPTLLSGLLGSLYGGR